MQFLILRIFINALGLVVAASLLEGISFDSPFSVLTSAVTVGIVNALIRPVLFILTLPLTILTLGLFTLVLNALLLKTVDWFVGGFHVVGFQSALLGAIVLSLVSFMGSRFLTEPKRDPPSY